MFTFDLIDGGYQIYLDGALYFRQEFRPGVAGVEPMAPDEAQASAEAMIAAMLAPLEPAEPTE